MAKRRQAIPTAVQTKLLRQSRRRCCLCFGLKADIEVKEGQIAHLDRNPSNNSLDNLTWLCLSHHDDYDSVRRQTKRLTPEEVKSYRSELYKQLANLMSPISEKTTGSPEGMEEELDAVLEVMHRYDHANKATRKVITVEILTRIERIYQYPVLHEAAMKDLERQKIPDEVAEARCPEIDREIREKLGLPTGIWSLGVDGLLPKEWRREAERLAKNWVAGALSYERCIDILWIFDELHDLDLHYLLFGLPNEDLTPLQKRGLTAFIFEHGQREFDPFQVPGTDDVPF